MSLALPTSSALIVSSVTPQVGSNPLAGAGSTGIAPKEISTKSPALDAPTSTNKEKVTQIKALIATGKIKDAKSKMSELKGYFKRNPKEALILKKQLKAAEKNADRALRGRALQTTTCTDLGIERCDKFEVWGWGYSEKIEVTAGFIPNKGVTINSNLNEGNALFELISGTFNNFEDPDPSTGPGYFLHVVKDQDLDIAKVELSVPRVITKGQEAHLKTEIDKLAKSKVSFPAPAPVHVETSFPEFLETCIEGLPLAEGQTYQFGETCFGFKDHGIEFTVGTKKDAKTFHLLQKDQVKAAFQELLNAAKAPLADPSTTYQLRNFLNGFGKIVAVRVNDTFSEDELKVLNKLEKQFSNELSGSTFEVLGRNIKEFFEESGETIGIVVGIATGLLCLAAACEKLKKPVGNCLRATLEGFCGVLGKCFSSCTEKVDEDAADSGVGAAAVEMTATSHSDRKDPAAGAGVGLDDIAVDLDKLPKNGEPKTKEEG